jgi:glycosyltransferase involved in cell wall biosynthesis
MEEERKETPGNDVKVDNLSKNERVVTLKRKHPSSALVSVIMPCHNAEEYLEEAFASVISQTYRPLEFVCFNDCSTDGSWTIMQSWKETFREADIIAIFIISEREGASGPGYGRNQAIQNSHGDFICHLDADDYMHPERVQRQYDLSQESEDLINSTPTLIGSNFVRFPPNSTPFYTDWLNQLTSREMLLQQYRECTIICPSWFYPRDVYSRVHDMNGMGFIEKDPLLGRVPEDLIFFLDHLLLGGTLAKVNRPLVTYRYVDTSWSIGTRALDLQRVRVKYLQERVLSAWTSFSIYGGGFDAKKFINLLSSENARKVKMFGDIAPKRSVLWCFVFCCPVLFCFVVRQQAWCMYVDRY